VSAAAASIYGA